MKVTVNNADKSTSKPFPKLMIYNGDWIGYFIADGECVWINGKYKGAYGNNVTMEGITDFNGSITLSND